MEHFDDPNSQSKEKTVGEDLQHVHYMLYLTQLNYIHIKMTNG